MDSFHRCCQGIIRKHLWLFTAKFLWSLLKGILFALRFVLRSVITLKTTFQVYIVHVVNNSLTSMETETIGQKVAFVTRNFGSTQIQCRFDIATVYLKYKTHLCGFYQISTYCRAWSVCMLDTLLCLMTLMRRLTLCLCWSNQHNE